MLVEERNDFFSFKMQKKMLKLLIYLKGWRKRLWLLCTLKTRIARRLMEQVMTLVRTPQLMKLELQAFLSERWKRLRPSSKQFIQRRKSITIYYQKRRRGSGSLLENGLRSSAPLGIERGARMLMFDGFWVVFVASLFCIWNYRNTCE